ncbi:MAG: DNRLRE domain-containing protein, partial [Pseudomonadota bacterium]|nr:DNRLRE domain-containing protein [Pseudomonadota bacterium]
TDTFNYTVADGRGASASASVTVSVAAPPSGTLTFAPTDDTNVKVASPDNTYGSATTLRVKTGSDEYRTYLKFSVSGLGGTTERPPPAKLRLFVTDPSPDGGTLYKTENTYLGSTNSWNEQGLTWNNAPPASGSPLASAGSTFTGTWAEIDVTGAITGDGTFSFVLISGSTNSAFYSSGEGANPPQLLVTP